MEQCPKCGSKSLAVETKTWVNIDWDEENERTDSEFDPGDACYAEPLPGGKAICRDCQHTWCLPANPARARPTTNRLTGRQMTTSKRRGEP